MTLNLEHLIDAVCTFLSHPPMTSSPYRHHSSSFQGRAEMVCIQFPDAPEENPEDDMYKYKRWWVHFRPKDEIAGPFVVSASSLPAPTGDTTTGVGSNCVTHYDPY